MLFSLSFLKKIPQFIFSSRKKIGIKKIIIGAILFGILFGGFVFQVFQKLKSQAPQYQTARVEKGTIVVSVNASGKVLTANILPITTQATGKVVKVYVSENDQVVSGQKIAEIELDVIGKQKYAAAWSNYLSAKNNLDSAKTAFYTLQAEMFSKWDTFKKLAESSTYQNPDGSPKLEQRALPEFLIAEKNWLAAESKYKNQEQVLAQAQAALNNALLSYQLLSPMIVAPFSGKISNLSIVEGMYLNSSADSSTSQGSSSFRIGVIQAEGSPPLLSFNIAEMDIAKIKIGQKATIIFDSFSDKTFTGKVVSVDRLGTTVNNVTSYSAVIRLDTSSFEILPNMAANASIIIEVKNDVLTVPSSAIRKQGNQSFVRIFKNGREEQVPVEIGLSSESQTEVISGLSEGEEVILGTFTTQSSSRTGSSIFSPGTFGGALRPGGARR